MTIHHLKTWPPYFNAIQSTEKKFELREDDRNFQVGDTLVLREWDPNVYVACSGNYTGREIAALVTYILRGESWGLAPNKCIMSIDVVQYYRNSG